MFDGFYNGLHTLGYNHSIHATQVHMPIGLTIGAFVLGIFSYLLANWGMDSRSSFTSSAMAAAARACIILAFLFWFSTVGTAIMDWEHFFSGAWLTSIKIKMSLAAFFFIVLCVAMLVGYRTKQVSKTLLGIYLVAVCTVIVLGFYGGELAEGVRVPEGPKQYLAGQLVFRDNCIGCHPGGSNKLKPTQVLWGSPMLASSAAFVDFIRHAPPPMPKIGKQRVSDQQAKELYQYLHAVMGGG